MLEETLKDVTRKMDQTIEAFRKELTMIRTGRANLSLLDGIQVDAYGSKMPLNQVAGLAISDANLLTVKPFDVTQLDTIEKAIRHADLGINPVNDGKIIKLPIPPLTEERRKEIAKKVNGIREDGKVALRNVRHHGRDEIKKLEVAKEISQDQEHTAYDEIQKMIDDHTKTIEQMSEAKEQEILTM